MHTSHIILKKGKFLCLSTSIVFLIILALGVGMTGCGGGGIGSSDVSVSSVSPSVGPPSGGTQITLIGQNFDNYTTVTVGSSAATDVTYISSTTLTAKTPAGDVGTVDVSVTSKYGISSTLANAFTYILPTLTVNVVDRDGNAVEGAFVMLGTDPSTEFQGTTDASGQISFSSEDLDDTQTITAGKSGYRNYTIFDYSQPQASADSSISKDYALVGSEPWEATITLSPLVRPHGWINTSIDATTWGDLADNCPFGPGVAPCEVRAAWINVPMDNISDSLNSTDCEACIGQPPILIPMFGMDQGMFPAFLDQARVTATAGLADFSDPWNMSATFSKFGVATFAIDSTNTAANAENVSIPLTIDMGDAWAVTIDLTNAQPAVDDEITEMLMAYIPPHGFAPIGMFSGMSLGGTEISEFAYRFRGLDPVQVAASQDMANAIYITRGELSKADGTYTAYTNSAIIMNDTQLFDIDYLLPSSHMTAPEDGEVLSGSGMDVSWTAPSDDFDLTLTSIGTLYFDGTETEDNVVWDIMAPKDRAEFSLPTFPDGTIDGLESCQVYEVNVTALSLTGFTYNDGIFGDWTEVFTTHLPVLESNDGIVMFTSGQDCGPLISSIDPSEGNRAGGDAVTIDGMYFGDAQGDSTVMFGASAGNVTAWSDSLITVETPAGPGDGAVKVIVTVDGQPSNDAYYVYH
ncbi:MAG: IPT/TIG domain-containing protein [Pseudomonadota bacterium]